MSHLVDILKAMTGQSDSDKEDDVIPNGVGSSHPLINGIKTYPGNNQSNYTGVIGSSGFSGFSGLSGYSGYSRESYTRSYTRQEMIESFIAGYKSFQLIEEDVKPEIIEMAKKHVATKY